jgi:hypothetical protein
MVLEPVFVYSVPAASFEGSHDPFADLLGWLVN